MKKIHTVTTLAVAGAMSVGVATAGSIAAGASTRSRQSATAVHQMPAGATVGGSVQRTVADGVFQVTRHVAGRAGVQRVVFCATDLRSGRTMRLN
jgi:hypothetical protein